MQSICIYLFIVSYFRYLKCISNIFCPYSIVKHLKTSTHALFSPFFPPISIDNSFAHSWHSLNQIHELVWNALPVLNCDEKFSYTGHMLAAFFFTLVMVQLKILLLFCKETHTKAFYKFSVILAYMKRILFS